MITQKQINKEIHKNNNNWASNLQRAFRERIDYETARILSGSNPSKPSAQVKSAHKHGTLKPYKGVIPDEYQIRVVNLIPYLVHNKLVKEPPTPINKTQQKRQLKQEEIKSKVHRELDKHFTQPSISSITSNIADNPSKVALYVRRTKVWRKQFDVQITHIRGWHKLIAQSSNTWLLAYKHGYAQTPEGAQLSTAMAWMHKEIRGGLEHKDYIKVPLHKVFVAELDGITSIGKSEAAAKTGLTTKIKNHVGNRLWD